MRNLEVELFVELKIRGFSDEDILSILSDKDLNLNTNMILDLLTLPEDENEIFIEKMIDIIQKQYDAAEKGDKVGFLRAVEELQPATLAYCGSLSKQIAKTTDTKKVKMLTEEYNRYIYLARMLGQARDYF